MMISLMENGMSYSSVSSSLIQSKKTAQVTRELKSGSKCASAGIRIVQPKKPGIGARIASRLCDVVDSLLVSLMGGSSGETNVFLDGNFGPVDESGPFVDLPITGVLPTCLNGIFVNIGPNPRTLPTAGYHWFDGDGMLHGLRIKDGKASYSSRYVMTSKLQQENFYGASKFLKVGDMNGMLGMFLASVYFLRVALGVINIEYGTGTANTAVVYHNKMLLALGEADRPYVIRILDNGDLETIGVLDYKEKLSRSVTAHPKVDPVTGEMFFFGYRLQAPHVVYQIISKEGFLHDPVNINIPDLKIMHDFAITENFVIFMDLPLGIKPWNLLKGKAVLSFDETKRSRFGVLPRYAHSDSQMQWFDLPTCFITHTANAWEEGDEVVLIACREPKFEVELQKNHIELYEFRFNLKTGSASQRQLTSGPALEFPRINDNYIGRKQKYLYAGISSDGVWFKGVVKLDLEKDPDLSDGNTYIGSNVVGIFEYGSGRYGSEAVFVPNGLAAEDDGYLITFVYDEKTGKSEAVVIDAKTMAADPVAVVYVPVRIPYGFHAVLVNEASLSKVVTARNRFTLQDQLRNQRCNLK